MTNAETTKIAQALKDACQAIAGNCDGAQSNDGVGFNKADSSFGHSVAISPANTWTPEICHEVREMLRKYRGQLAEANIIYDELPAVERQSSRGRSVEAGHLKQVAAKYEKSSIMREFAKGYLSVRETKMQVGDFRLMKIVEKDLVVSFPFDRDLVDAIKTINYRDRRWDAISKRWFISSNAAADALRLIKDWDFAVTDEDMERIKRAADRTPPGTTTRPKPPKPRLKSTVSFDGDRIILRAPYNAEMTEPIRAIAGRKWESEEKVNTFPTTQAAAILKLASDFNLYISDEARAKLANFETLRAQKVEQSAAVDADIVIPGLAEGIELYPFQKAGVEYALEAKRAIIGDEMGCISGDAIIRINRGGNTRKFTLRQVFERFKTSWDSRIPTQTASLTDAGELRLNTIHRVIHKGIRNVVKIKLASGKELVCTHDHEIAQPNKKWTPAEQLSPGDHILTNGKPSCKGCGNTDDVITYKHAKFLGYCKKCMYRTLRKKNSKGGKSIDGDGYVRISGQQDHPRANAGQVYEHILVMEDHLGRPVSIGEDIHHKNGNNADNRIENLEVISRSEHHKRHSKHKNFQGGKTRDGKSQITFVPIEDNVISIHDAGETDVYDIVMGDPCRNFVANGVIVHNCGKTPQGMCTVQAANAYPCLVICPKAVKFQWGDEIEKFLPGRTTVTLGTKTPLDGSDFTIINYDILNKRPDLKSAGFKSVIIDESHYLKNAKVQRSVAAREITDAAGVEYIIMLTGTPVLNRPVELTNQLDILGRLNSDFGGFFKFAMKYCDATQNSHGWDFKGASNLDELAVRLRETCFVRREKKDVCTELPELQRSIVTVETTSKTKFKRATKALTSWMAEVQDNNLMDRRQFQAAALVEIGKLKKLAVELKYKSAMEWLNNALESGEKMVVFAHHKDIQAKIFDDLSDHNPARIWSDDNDARRTANINKFRDDDTCKVIVVSLKAGNIGLNLQCASNVVFFEFAWHAADMDQAEARVHRIGSDAESINSYWLAAEGTFDDELIELIESKRSITNAINNGHAKDPETDIVKHFATLLGVETN